MLFTKPLNQVTFLSKYICIVYEAVGILFTYVSVEDCLLILDGQNVQNQGKNRLKQQSRMQNMLNKCNNFKMNHFEFCKAVYIIDVICVDSK